MLDNHRANAYILGVSTASFQRPGMLLVNGRIYQDVDTAEPVASLAIEGGRVVATGTGEAARATLPAGTPTIDLGGRTVLPAFIESHTHFHRSAVLSRFFLDFESLRPASLDDVLGAVAARATEVSPDAWIQGDGLSPARLAEGRLPDRQALDLASDGRAVVLRGIGKHVVAASSAALAAAGIDASTPDPPGGRIEHEAGGAPSGILHERGKLRLDQSAPDTVVPAPAAADRRAALRDAVRDLHRYGIGTLHEMVRLPDEAADWTALHQAGELGVRVRLFYRVHESPLDLAWLEALGIRRGLGDDRLAVLGVKVSVDGFCIFRNALVHEPYPGEPANCGLQRIEPERLRDLVARANAQGLQVAVHAVGARAVDMALDAFEAAGPAHSVPYRLEHGYVDLDRARLLRMRDLGVTWSTQPAFRTAYAREWTDAFGAERRDRLMPLAEADALGIGMLFNSDAPCAPIDPLGGIRAAVSGGATPAGSVSRRAAWRAFTSEPADAAGEPSLGRLVPGSPADLVAFDDDPFAATTDIATATVSATVIGGHPAFDPGRTFG
jgi:predicted amidohydrolase YtcJ